MVSNYAKIIMVMAVNTNRKFIWAGAILIAIILIGTTGYWLIGGRQHSLIDAIYMTVITITTVGFSEIIDLSGNTVGRIFTIFIAISGIGVIMYVITNLTALIVEGRVTKSFRRRKMEKMANKAKDHYIVCGVGSVGFHIVCELQSTKRPHIIIDIDKKNLEKTLESFPDEIFVEGDATENSILNKAGIEKARGLFAVTADDNQNLVMSLTAKQLNPKIRVVARCDDIRNSERIQKAGADAVISPGLIGGLRMASEMIRPMVVSFLDTMLRDRENNLRVEEVSVPDYFNFRAISALNLREYPHTLLLAIKTKEDWLYNPPDSYIVQPNDTLLFMTTPDGRTELEGLLQTNL